MKNRTQLSSQGLRLGAVDVAIESGAVSGSVSGSGIDEKVSTQVSFTAHAQAGEV